MTDWLYLDLPEFDPDTEEPEEYDDMADTPGGFRGFVEEGCKQIREFFLPEDQPEERDDSKPRKKRKKKKRVARAEPERAEPEPERAPESGSRPRDGGKRGSGPGESKSEGTPYPSVDAAAGGDQPEAEEQPEAPKQSGD